MLTSMLKRLPWIVLVLVLAGVLLVPERRIPPPKPRADRLTVEQIQGLSNLVSARVQVADVMLVDQHGLTGGIQVAAVIRGDYLLSTDLSQARFDQIDPVHHRALLVLAPPTASSPRVDLEHSRLFGLSEYGLWQIAPGDRADITVVNKAYRQAQASIVAASADPLALQQARRQAETVLVSFLRAMGWDISVRWLDQPTTRPTSSLPERTLTVSDTHAPTQPDRALAELRARLAERLGYLAARRWLRDNVPASPGSSPQDRARHGDGNDARRTLSYKTPVTAPVDGDSP